MFGKARFDPAGDVREDIRSKYGYEGDLLDLYAGNTGPAVHKWHHYIPIYEQYFSRFRGTNVRFLEIGVSKGGSLQLWRNYLGEDATIFGIDINPDCAQYDGQSGQVRIGSQDDPDFLTSVVEEMGGIDVVLDDGSHHMDHLPVTLEVLFPLLTDGGVYMIEDLHTAYWRGFGGGYRRNTKNFFNYVRDLFDDMHRWYHGNGCRVEALDGAFSAVHVHDSIVVLDKGPVHAPVHSIIGG